MLDNIVKGLLREVADLGELPATGAFNIRLNGQTAARSSSPNVQIISKTDKPGINIIIKPGTVGETLHIPVVISESGVKETVYNDFLVGDDCDITIMAGCGIHNCGDSDSAHDGIHTFRVGKNAKVRYIERHYGEGEGRGKRLMNPTTIVHLAEGASVEMENTQISGVDDTVRKTNATLEAGATLIVHEKVMTTGTQQAISDFVADMNGEGCHCDIVSRTVARDQSHQKFVSTLNGNAACTGHTECDSILMDSASVIACPQLTATCIDASLIHEAAIGKIAGEQIIKLMTLGLTEQEAEEQIVNGFLN
ncbi:MAG: SufD family Fe-S cluster assembly protein [Clostridia bacterium]|nr:SufD family Fe-S cluster assembly protein [Clostridia bacterium]